MSSPFEINIQTAQLNNIPPIYVDLNLSRHISGRFKYSTHLTTEYTSVRLCKWFANWAIIEDLQTHSDVQRFDSVVGRKPATALLFCFFLVLIFYFMLSCR